MTILHRQALVLASLLVGASACSADAHGPGTHERPQKDMQKDMQEHSGEHEQKSAAAATNALERSDAPADAKLYFISPADGAEVTSPLVVRFGLTGMGVAPAGTEVAKTGHHHLLIDVEEMPSFNAPLPATDNIVHFGGGQTQTEIKLEPGVHSLQLLLGNYVHVPHDPPVMSEQIQITVVE